MDFCDRTRPVENHWYQAWAVLLVSLLLRTFAAPVPASGVEILSVKTNHRDGTYSSTIEMDLSADAEEVRALLLEFENYTELHDGVKESRVLSRQEDGRVRARFIFRACVLIFCRNITYVMDFREEGEDYIIGDLVPGKGDFHRGFVKWRLSPLPKGTRLMVKSEFEPSFWIPPLIGPYFVGRALKREAITMMRSVESRAEKGSG